MKELQKRQNTRRILYSIPSLLLISVISVILARGAVGAVNKERVSSEQSIGLKAKLIALTLREQELGDGVARLETEEGIKGEIRERFGVTEEGELVAVIVDDKREASSSDSTTDLPWYKRLWNDIIGNK